MEIVNITNNLQGVHIPNAKIVAPWSNFSGVKDNFGSSKRNFTLLLPPDIAAELTANGWPVRSQDPARVAEGEAPEYYLKVYVQYHDEPNRKKYDPKVHLVSGGNVTDMTAETISLFDSIQFDNVDLIFTPYNWTVGGRSGVSAYLHEGYFVQSASVFAGYGAQTPTE